MRPLPASLVLSSIVLGGWLTAAKAQNLGPQASPSTNPSLAGQAGGSGDVSSGFIPQPSPDSPGLVLGVTLGEIYTDNVKLATRGTPKQSSWITTIEPFVKAAWSNPRFSGLLDYTLAGYLYDSGPGHNQIAQSLNANGTFAVLPQHFFIDGYAQYGRQIINNALPAASSSFFLDNNHANVASGALSPYWLQDLGKVGTLTARYIYGRVIYNDRGIPGVNHNQLSGIPDVTSNAAQLSLMSPTDQKWGWNAIYSEQRLDPDFGSSLTFAVARAGISYQVNDSVQLLADAGKETKFKPDGTTEKLGAPFWDAGVEWATARDNFRLLAGHRFFGRSYELSWTHQAALLTTNLSYIEQPTDYNQQLLGLNPGMQVLPPINIRPILPSLIERQPYLSKRLSATAAYTMPESTLTVTAYNERRTFFEEDNKQERVTNVGVDWLFNLGVRTTLTPSVYWQRYQFRTGQTSYRRYAQMALVHQFDTRNIGSLLLRHDSSSVFSGVPGAHGYLANIIFLQWIHLFME